MAEAFPFLCPKCFDPSWALLAGSKGAPAPVPSASTHLCPTALLCTHKPSSIWQGEEVVLGTGLESSTKQNKKGKIKAVVLRKVKPTPFLHKYHQGRGG